PPTWTGLPGSSTDLSARAVPLYPEEPDECSYLLLPRRFWLRPLRKGGHSWFRLTRLNRVRFTLRLTRSLHEASSVRLLARTLVSLRGQRAIATMDTFQSTRSARLRLAHLSAAKDLSGSAW